MGAPCESAGHFAVSLSRYGQSLLFPFVNAFLSSKKHFRLSNDVKDVGGFCLCVWLIDLQMVAINIITPGSYIANINLWSKLEAQMEI